MSIAALIRRMSEAGAPPEAIALAVEAIEAANAKEEERKAKQRERTAKSRAKTRDSNVTVTPVSHDGNGASLSDKERSPTPPKEINSPSSETNVSGAAAPNSGFGQNVIVLADPRADLFGRGLKILTTITGKPESQLRGLLGRWLKAANDDAVKVLRAIEDAARDKRAEPVSWIEAALKSKAPAGSREAFLKRGLI